MNDKLNRNIVSDLADSWNESGIKKGDIVIIHSSLSKFLKRYKEKNIILTPNNILDSFLEAVGDKGTLLFPTFNFEFTKGKTFDIRNTKSETGMLTETARLHPLSVRTGHPLFSFAALGYRKDLFEGLYNFSAFGKDSPFGKVLELDGKLAAFDVPGAISMTFYHFVEEMENAPHRYHKIFTGPYIDYDGTERVREFGLYARNLEMGVVTDIKQTEELIWSKNLYSGNRPGEGNGLSVIDAQTLYKEVAKVIRDGRGEGMLYKIVKD